MYSSSATSFSLCLFTEADLQAGKVTCELPLSPELNRTGYTWHILLPKLDTTLLYGIPQIAAALLLATDRLPRHNEVDYRSRPKLHCMNALKGLKGQGNYSNRECMP